MSEIARRIVVSHKEAAKRAALHLKESRNLKLSSTESLELVARVLGIANWQTLLGQAVQGRGPRINEGSPGFVAGEPSTCEVTPEEEPVKTAVELLSAYFYKYDEAREGEHPQYPRSDWQYEVRNGDCSRSYWDFVVSNIESNQEMFPWERDAYFPAKLAKACGFNISHFPEVYGKLFMGWCARHSSERDPSIVSCSSEQAAYVKVFELVQSVLTSELQQSALQLKTVDAQSLLKLTQSFGVGEFTERLRAFKALSAKEAT